MTESTIWDTQHGPVLRAAVTALNADRAFAGIRLPQIAEATALESTDVVAACRALEAAGYLEMRWYMPPGRASSVVRVSERAQREAGAWPTPDAGAERIEAALNAILENSNDPEERTRAQKILEALAGSGRQIAVGVATAVLTGQVT